MHRPVQAITPFGFIGKEIEKRAQEGEDVAVLENIGPIQYSPRRTAKTRAADPRIIERTREYGLRQLMRESGASQHATERFIRGERIHPGTRKKLADAVDKLEHEGMQCSIQAFFFYSHLTALSTHRHDKRSEVNLNEIKQNLSANALFEPVIHGTWA